VCSLGPGCLPGVLIRGTPELHICTKALNTTQTFHVCTKHLSLKSFAFPFFLLKNLHFRKYIRHGKRCAHVLPLTRGPRALQCHVTSDVAAHAANSWLIESGARAAGRGSGERREQQTVIIPLSSTLMFYASYSYHGVAPRLGMTLRSCWLNPNELGRGNGPKRSNKHHNRHITRSFSSSTLFFEINRE